jgi:hypothetical protein
MGTIQLLVTRLDKDLLRHQGFPPLLAPPSASVKIRFAARGRVEKL